MRWRLCVAAATLSVLRQVCMAAWCFTAIADGTFAVTVIAWVRLMCPTSMLTRAWGLFRLTLTAPFRVLNLLVCVILRVLARAYAPGGLANHDTGPVITAEDWTREGSVSGFKESQPPAAFLAVVLAGAPADDREVDAKAAAPTPHSAHLRESWAHECLETDKAQREARALSLEDHAVGVALDGYHTTHGLRLHRVDEDSHGARCGRHGRTEIHGLVPDFVATLRGAGRPSDEFITFIAPAVKATLRVLAHHQPGDVIGVMGTDERYEGAVRDSGRVCGFTALYAFVPPGMEGKHFRGKDTIVPIPVRMYGGTRSLAIYRLLALHLAPAGVRVVVLNRNPECMPSGHLNHLARHADEDYSFCQYTYFPVNCSFHHERAALTRHFERLLAYFEIGGYIYGTDEVFLLHAPKVTAHYDLSHKYRVAAVHIADRHTHYPMLLRTRVCSGDREVTSHFNGFSREVALTLIAQEEMLVGLGPRLSPTLAACLGFTSRPDLGSLRILTREEYLSWLPVVRSRRSMKAGPLQWQVGPLVLFTFGTRGDVLPVEALGRRLTALGFQVALVALCTSEEGAILLAAAEANEALRTFPVFRRALLDSSACPWLHWAPIYLADPSASLFSLAPHPSVARPPRGGLAMGWDAVFSFLLSALEPAFHIGAYAQTPWWLPRSADGTTFLKRVENTGEVEEAVMHGSSGILPPPGMAGLPAVPGGDHLKILPRYKRVHFHGGAGTAQTGAVCGVKMVSFSNAVDRRYLDRENTAGDVQPGADPDLVLMALGTRHPKIFLAYLSLHPEQWWMWLTWVVPRHGVWFLLGTAHILIGVMGSFRLPIVWSLPAALAGVVMPTGMPAVAAAVVAWVISLAYSFLTREFGVTTGDTIRAAVNQVYKAMSCKCFPLLTVWGGVGFAILVAPLATPFVTLGLRVLLAVLGLATSPTRRDLPRITQKPVTEVALAATLVLDVGVPLVHTSLVCPGVAKRYDGHFTGSGTGPGDPFTLGHREFDVIRGMRRTCYIATDMTRSEFLNLPTTTRGYGAFWNCQSALMAVITTSQARLGFGAFFIMALLSMHMFTVVGAAVVCLALISAVLSIPSHYSGVSPVTIFPSLAWLYRGLESEPVVEYAWLSVFLRRARALLVTAFTGFGGERRVHYTLHQIRGSVSSESSTWSRHSTASMAGSAMEYVAEEVPFETAVRQAMVPRREGEPPGQSISREGLEKVARFTQDFLSHFASAAKGSVPYEARAGEMAVELESLVSEAGAARFLRAIKEAPVGNYIDEEYVVAEAATDLPTLGGGLHERLTHRYMVAYEKVIVDHGPRLGTERDRLARFAPPGIAEAAAMGLSCPGRLALEGFASRSRDLGVIEAILAERRYLEQVREEIACFEVALLRRVIERHLTPTEIVAPGPGTDGSPGAFEGHFDQALHAFFKLTGGSAIHDPQAEDAFLVRWGEFLTPYRLACLRYLVHEGPHRDDELAQETGRILAECDPAEVVPTVNDITVTPADFGGLAALAVEAGVDPDVAHESALRTMAHYEESREAAGRRRRVIHSLYAREVFDTHRKEFKDSFSYQYQDLVRVVQESLLKCSWYRKLVEGIIHLAGEVKFGLCQVAVDIVSGMLQLLTDFQEDVPVALGLKIARGFGMILRAASLVNRGSRKVVWAPLFTRTLDPTSRADLMLASIAAPGQDTESQDTSLAKTVRLLEEVLDQDADVKPLPSTFNRPVYRPKKTRGTVGEFEGVPDPPELLGTPGLEARVADYLKRGSKQGIDGVWMYDNEKGHRSLSRYATSMPESPAWLEEKVIETADAMIENSPETYLDMKMLPPKQVLAYIQKKYSPGLPFIGVERSRKDLFNTPWGRAVIDATQKCLKTGNYPGIWFHAFPKMQVVDKEKIVEGKPIRTVVAQDLTSYFGDQVLFLERNKRPVSVASGAAIGVKLNQAGLLPYFEAILSRKRAAKFDQKEYDANVPPVIHSGLAHLGARGYEGRAGSAAMAAVIRQRYTRLQHGGIVLLSDGSTHPKERGGATGHSATSWDGTHGMQLALITAWSIVTERPPSEFWKTNSIINQSDDNLWGTDDEFDWDDLIAVQEKLFGSHVTLESTDRDKFNFLGKQAVPVQGHEQDYALIGRAPPPVVVRTDESGLLMRRTAYTTLVGARPSVEFERARLQRTVGHSYLAAHNRPFYSRLAQEWMEDVTVFLRVPLGTPLFDVEFDEEGHIMSVDLRSDFNSASRDTEARVNFVTGKAFLPSYRRVLFVHLEPDSEERKNKRYIKLATKAPGLEPLEYVHLILANVRSVVSALTPAYIVHLKAASGLRPLILPFTVLDFMIEEFVYRKFVEKAKQPPTLQEFESACNECPYRGSMDPAGFLWWRDVPANATQLEGLELYALQNYCMTITMVYVLMNLVFIRLQKTRVLGRLIEFFFLYTVDLPKLYSVLNLMYWHVEGRSSLAISGLAPYDPYAATKKGARLITAVIPTWVHYVMPTPLVTWLLPLVAEAAAKWLTWKPFRRAVNTGMGQLPSQAKWQTVAADLVAAIEDGPEHSYDYLSSPTATGKSTMLVACLLALRPTWWIWLILPRRINRDEYTNAFCNVAPLIVQRGTDVTGHRLVVSTYGQFIARYGRVSLDNCYVLLDELHEGRPEMVVVAHWLRKSRRLGLTATPRPDLYPEYSRVYETRMQRPFKVEVQILDGGPEVLFQELMSAFPEHAKRCLLFVPGVRRCHAIADLLANFGLRVKAVHRHDTHVPLQGCIVATQVADSGLDIPGVTAAVDTGVEIVVHRGKLVKQNSTWATCLQREGRLGRRSNGIMFRPSWAGTGPPAIVYPTWALFTRDQDTKDLFGRLYGLTMTLAPIAEAYRVGSGVDPTVIRPEMTTTVLYEERGALVTGLAAYYAIVTTVGVGGAARDAYIKVASLNIYPDTVAPVESRLKELRGLAPLMSFNDLGKWVAARPFLTRIDGVDMQHAGLRLVGSTVKLIDHEKV